MKKNWSDGTHALVFDPPSFIGRLLALVPPPRFHMLRMHGCLVFGAVVTVCIVCGGRMRVSEFATTPKAIAGARGAGFKSAARGARCASNQKRSA